MIARICAWLIVLAVCGLIWQYGNQWRSPWAVVSSPVLSQLPASSRGCTDNCK